MEYTYRFRLYPNAEQIQLIQKTFGCTRFVYNYFLALRKQAWEDRKETLNYYACSALLTKLKHDGEHEWLNVAVDRFYPSSQTCSCCGYKNADVKDLSVRSWICPQCGAQHDRDRNAAANILAEAQRQLSA